MDAKTFYTLVKQMRAKQKEYYANKAHGITDLRLLSEKKDLEKKLDAEIARVEAIINRPATQLKIEM